VYIRYLGNVFTEPLPNFFLIYIVGGESKLGPLGTSATEWPIVPAPGDYDDGEIGRMKIGKGNRSTRRKPAPAPLCPPQIPLDQTRAAAVGSQGLTAWAMARPLSRWLATIGDTNTDKVSLEEFMKYAVEMGPGACQVS
jgi:hypothetical protein